MCGSLVTRERTLSFPNSRLILSSKVRVLHCHCEDMIVSLPSPLWQKELRGDALIRNRFLTLTYDTIETMCTLLHFPAVFGVFGMRSHVVEEVTSQLTSHTFSCASLSRSRRSTTT